MTFWYGLGFADLSEMPITAIQAYMQDLPARQAEMKLMLYEVESMPNMKKHDQENRLKNWLRSAGIASSTARKATPGILKMMGIGVRHV